MKLHDCEAIDIEIWKCRWCFNRSWECQESSEKLLRNFRETTKIVVNRYVWDMPDIFLRYAWFSGDVPEIYQIFGYNWYLPEIYFRYARDVPEICQNYLWDMSNVWQLCALEIPVMYPGYTWNCSEICLKYDGNIQDIWLDLLESDIGLRYTYDFPEI